MVWRHYTGTHSLGQTGSCHFHACATIQNHLDRTYFYPHPTWEGLVLSFSPPLPLPTTAPTPTCPFPASSLLPYHHHPSTCLWEGLFLEGPGRQPAQAHTHTTPATAALPLPYHPRRACTPRTTFAHTGFGLDYWFGDRTVGSFRLGGLHAWPHTFWPGPSPLPTPTPSALPVPTYPAPFPYALFPTPPTTMPHHPSHPHPFPYLCMPTPGSTGQDRLFPIELHAAFPFTPDPPAAPVPLPHCLISSHYHSPTFPFHHHPFLQFRFPRSIHRLPHPQTRWRRQVED